MWRVATQAGVGLSGGSSTAGQILWGAPAFAVETRIRQTATPFKADPALTGIPSPLKPASDERRLESFPGYNFPLCP